MVRVLATVALIGLAAPVWAQDDPVREAVIDYMDFATASAGIILPQQVDRDVFQAAAFYDVRSDADFAAGHIPGATHIEWRALPARFDELPTDSMVIFYCNTGVRSAQVTFAARLLGHENVLVMQGGYNGWLEHGAYRPE